MKTRTKIDKKLAIELHDGGKSPKQIADIMGCSIEGAYRVLRTSTSYKPQNRNRFDSETEKQILNEYKMCVSSLEKLAERFECEKSTIRNVIVRLGGEIRKQGVHFVGKDKTINGYKYIHLLQSDKHYKMVNSQGIVAEHRYVMAKHLNRDLDRKETVHHIDGDRTNNKIENLQLRSSHHGPGVVHVCLNCGSKNISAVNI